MPTSCKTPLHSQVESTPSLEPQTLRTRDGYVSGEARRTEFILGPTGRFRSLIEQYMTTVAVENYQPRDLLKVRGSIAMFFRYVVNELHVDDPDLIRPSSITSYIDHRRDLGYRSVNFLGHLASFFVWLTGIALYDRGNPVINRFHRERMTASRNGNSNVN
ncbi:MAG TPA: hypothetical protein VGI45_20260 [Terracidiphilus sp.]